MNEIDIINKWNNTGMVQAIKEYSKNIVSDQQLHQILMI